MDLRRKGRSQARGLMVGLPLLVVACEGGPSDLQPTPGAAPPPPDLEIVSTAHARALDTGDWSVEVALENGGGDGEFRVVILAGDDTTRLTEAFRIRAGERFGRPPGLGGGFFSPGPRRPTLITVEAREREPQPWTETDRAEVLN